MRRELEMERNGNGGKGNGGMKKGKKEGEKVWERE
jgi:hypothetical protein